VREAQGCRGDLPAQIRTRHPAARLLPVEPRCRSLPLPWTLFSTPPKPLSSIAMAICVNLRYLRAILRWNLCLSV